jgi:hypothetical protein
MRSTTILLRIVFAVLFALIVLGSCSKPPDEKMLYGTWTNDVAQAGMRKMVNTPGEFKEYTNVSDTTPAEEGTRKIISSWTDSEENAWFKTFNTFTSGPLIKSMPMSQALIKISKSGTMWEGMGSGVTEYNPKSFPTKIDPTDNWRYLTYHRASE